MTKLKVNEYLDDRALLKKQKDLIRELQSKIDHYQNDFENSKVERLEREMQVNKYIKVINLALCCNSYIFGYLISNLKSMSISGKRRPIRSTEDPNSKL